MFLFSLLHVISAAAFPVQVRLDRERRYCDVLPGVGFFGEKKKSFFSALHTSKIILEVCL